MKTLLKESLLILLTIIPLIYLLTLWDQLPQTVPTHFDLQGNANGWSDKSSLPWITGGLGFGMYLLFLILPVLDPKKKIEQMGSKYFTLRFILTFFIALINCFILYSAKSNDIGDMSFLFAIMGAMFAAMGNYFQTVRPNYFIGIRTPWTLENETVWKKTHCFAGRIWMIGGLLIVLISFLVQRTDLRSWLIGGILAAIILIPVISSYLIYKKEKQKNIN